MPRSAHAVASDDPVSASVQSVGSSGRTCPARANSERRKLEVERHVVGDQDPALEPCSHLPGDVGEGRRADHVDHRQPVDAGRAHVPAGIEQRVPEVLDAAVGTALHHGDLDDPVPAPDRQARRLDVDDRERRRSQLDPRARRDERRGRLERRHLHNG